MNFEEIHTNRKLVHLILKYKVEFDTYDDISLPYQPVKKTIRFISMNRPNYTAVGHINWFFMTKETMQYCVHIRVNQTNFETYYYSKIDNAIDRIYNRLLELYE